VVLNIAGFTDAQEGFALPIRATVRRQKVIKRTVEAKNVFVFTE
jgi:hypothetical protein